MKTIIVIIDPDQTNRSALERANYIAGLTGADVRLLLCLPEPHISSHGTVPEADIKEAIVDMELKNLQQMCDSMELVSGITKSQIIFSKPVIDGLVNEIELASPDIVIKESNHQPSIKRTLFSNTDWQLIRQCPTPLMLTKPSLWPNHPRITVAVDAMREDDDDNQLANGLIKTGLDWQSLTTGELKLFHSIDTDIVLNSYVTPDESFIEQLKLKHQQSCQQLIESHSLSNNQLILREGKVEQSLPSYVNETLVNLVVMGVVSYNPLERMLIGSSAEKVLDRLCCDILLIKAEPHTGN